MCFYASLWVFMGLYVFLWVLIGFYGFTCVTMCPSQATKNVNKTLQKLLFWLKKKRFVFLLSQLSFNVFTETEPSKIGIFLVCISMFFSNVFKMFF